MSTLFSVDVVATQIGFGLALGLSSWLLGLIIWIPLRVFVLAATPDKTASIGSDTLGE
jgi:hypothetical protein